VSDARAKFSSRPLLVLFILAGLAIAVLLWKLQTGFGPRAAASARECRLRYEAARTLKDTARVDVSYPTAYQRGLSGSSPETCRAFR
jgi:hypothetical protein